MSRRRRKPPTTPYEAGRLYIRLTRELEVMRAEIEATREVIATAEWWTLKPKRLVEVRRLDRTAMRLSTAINQLFFDTFERRVSEKVKRQAWEMELGLDPEK